MTEAQAHLEAELKSSKKIGINKEAHAKLNQVPWDSHRFLDGLVQFRNVLLFTATLLNKLSAYKVAAVVLM